MIRRPPRSTRTDTLFPYTTLFRSQRRLVLEGAGRIEQPLHLGHGQNDWDLANLLGADQLARKVGAVEGVREEEPQRTHDAVHRRCGDARLLLLDLDLPDILGARGVGRTSEPGPDPYATAPIVQQPLRADPPPSNF